MSKPDTSVNPKSWKEQFGGSGKPSEQTTQIPARERPKENQELPAGTSLDDLIEDGS